MSCRYSFAGYAPVPNCPRGPVGTNSLRLTRIERIAQSVAGEGEPEDCERDRKGGDQTKIPIELNVLAAVRDHLAQTGHRLIDADSEEAQPRFREYRRRYCQRDRNDHWRHGIREQVTHRDLELGRPGAARCSDVLHVAQRKDLSPHQAAMCDPTRNTDHKRDVEYGAAEKPAGDAAVYHREQEDGEEDTGERSHDLDEPEHDEIC